MTRLNTVIAQLQKERDATAAQLAQLDEALAVLGGVGSKTGAARRNKPRVARSRPMGVSVRSRVLDLLEETDRVWTAGDLLSELERRNDPIANSDAAKLIRTTLSQLNSERHIVRVAKGHYRAAKFVRPALGPAAAIS